MKALVAMLALCAAACTVDRKSQQFQCISTTDCKDGRVCTSGYCVTGPGSGGSGSGQDPACASQCTSCDHSTTPPTCVIDGALAGTVSCPTDAPCKVECTQPGACSTVTCDSTLGCTILCTSSGACGAVTCSAGPCSVDCTTASACNNVTCQAACSCNVTCANKPACGTMSCPTDSQGNACTIGGAAGSACSSTPAGCDSC